MFENIETNVQSYSDSFLDFLKELDSYMQIPGFLPGAKCAEVKVGVTFGGNGGPTVYGSVSDRGVKAGVTHDIGTGSTNVEASKRKGNHC